MVTSCFRNFYYARSVKMDTSDTSSDLTDSQWHDIGESYLTDSQFEDLFSDWSQRDKPENDCIQSDNEVMGWIWTVLKVINQKGKENQVIVNYQGIIKLE